MKKIRLSLPESGFPGQYLKPTPFFAGVILGFLACCVSGFICFSNHHLQNFERFHFFISPYTAYYPSCGQLLSLFRQSREEQTIVIIGGNSVFNGFGQRRTDLWSEQLKRNLGEKYFVVNCAFDGGMPFECGSWLAEALLKQDRKVIYITTVEPNQVMYPCGLHLRRAFFDLYNRGMLLDCPVREGMLSEALNPAGPQANDDYINEDIGSRIDKVTYAKELWQWVGYNLFCTNWCYGTHPHFYLPRRLYKDSYVPKADRSETLNEVRKIQLCAEHHALVRQTLEGKWVSIDANWEKGDKNIEVVPLNLIEHSIVFVPKHSPELLDHFSKIERSRYDAVLQITAEKWSHIGADSLVLGTDFTVNDYADMRHFSAAGGKRIAKTIADTVRQTAQRLGYEK